MRIQTGYFILICIIVCVQSLFSKPPRGFLFGSALPLKTSYNSAAKTGILPLTSFIGLPCCCNRNVRIQVGELVH